MTVAEYHKGLKMGRVTTYENGDVYNSCYDNGSLITTKIITDTPMDAFYSREGRPITAMLPNWSDYCSDD